MNKFIKRDSILNEIVPAKEQYYMRPSKSTETSFDKPQLNKIRETAKLVYMFDF